MHDTEHVNLQLILKNISQSPAYFPGKMRLRQYYETKGGIFIVISASWQFYSGVRKSKSIQKVYLMTFSNTSAEMLKECALKKVFNFLLLFSRLLMCTNFISLISKVHAS